MANDHKVRSVIASPSGRILSTLNWLRAGVLGANDGIVSTAAIIFGVAGAAASYNTTVLAAIAAVAAGALSMAAGEYVSVATQRDLEQAELARQREDIENDPERELQILAKLFEQRGVDADVADVVARQMSANDALSVHARAELGIDPEAITNPWLAAIASLIAFVLGGLVPITAILVSPSAMGLWLSGAAVVLGMILTGAISARIGRMAAGPAIARTVSGGLLAIGVTYEVGVLAGTQL